MPSIDRKLEVKAVVSIDGEPVNYVSLKIHQEMGEHHDFELVLDHKTFDAQFFNSPDKQLRLAHSKVVCDLQHGGDKGHAYVFSGVVTNVRMIAEDGMHGGVMLVGKSNTIELERGEMMQTYSHTDLKQILDEVTGKTLNLEVAITPAWKAKIDFAVQCRESDWDFLRRLCRQYNERFYYTGLDLYVGPHPEFPVVPLKYDVELRSLEIGSRLVPNQFTNYYYKRDDHSMLVQNSPADIEGATNYLQQVSGRSDRLTMGRKPNVPVAAYVPDMGSLIEAAKFRKVAAGSRMLYIRGECKTCDVRIGRLVDISFPKNMIGSGVGLYRVYSVTHHLEETGKYKCLFEAVPADLEYLAMPDVPIPTPYPIEAEVIDNNDPLGLGRVMVKFPFDKNFCDAWIPVMSLDAGGNGYGQGPASRGFSFIPELKDSVLVSFLNPQQLAQPFVMGSMFHGANAVNLGGGKGNHIKTITDKSFGQIIMNTDEKGDWGITIRDRKGNLVNIDTQGENITVNANKNITINAGETMTLNCKNMNINVEENMQSFIGENMATSVGKNQQTAVAETIEISSKNVEETYIEDVNTTIGEKQTTTTGESELFTTKGNVVIKSAGKALVQGAKDARISKG